MCRFAYDVASQEVGMNLEVWVPAIIAIISLVVNIVFSVFVAPKVIRENEYRTKLFEVCSEFFEYLSGVPSLSNYNGVPTKIRNYSLKIHLMFKEGSAPKELSESLENVFQKVKKRKELTEASEIDKWNDEFRNELRTLRKKIACYTGLFK